MATKTLHRIINGQNDVAAVLSNSSLCRLMSIGSNWQRLRVALRLRVTDSGANVQGSPVFVVGVCSGTSQPYNNGAGNTQHFFGCYENATTWTRTAASGGVPANYATTTNGGVSLRRVGTTTGSAGGPLHYTCRFMTETRCLYFVDILKAVGNWSMLQHCKGHPADAYDCTYEDFIDKAVLDTFTFQNHGSYGWRSANYTPNEAANGYFDAVNVSWDRSNPKIEISDLAVVRFA